MSRIETTHAGQCNPDDHYTSEEIDDFRIFAREWFNVPRIDLVIDLGGVYARLGAVDADLSQLKSEPLADPAVEGSGNRGAL